MQNELNTKNISSNQRKIIAFTILLILVSFYFLRNIYIPIFIGYFLAFLLNPIVTKAEKKGFGRIGPMILMLSFLFAVVGAFTILMTPRITHQIQELFEKLPFLFSVLSERFSPISIKYLGYDIFTQWRELAQNLIPKFAVIPTAEIIEGFFSGTVRALSTLLTILLIPIFTFYFLKDYYRINAVLLGLVPRRHLIEVQEVMRRLSRVLGALIRGQFLVCIILATYYSITLGAIGIDMALLLGTFAGLMNLVPVVGPLVSLVLTILFALMGEGGLLLCAQILGIYVLANLMDNTVLTPKIVGRQVGISPLMIILGILAGGELLGFLGILLALPVMAMIKVLGEYFLERYKASTYYNAAVELAGKQSLSDKL